MSETSTVPATGFVEEVEIHGHIIDSLLLPKVFDEILMHGASYVIKDIKIGQRQTDTSYARIEVRAPSAGVLREVLCIAGTADMRVVNLVPPLDLVLHGFA